MNLTIDIGNSQYKLCVFDNRNILYSTTLASINKQNIDAIIDKYPISFVIYSDTRGVSYGEIATLFPETISILELNHEISLPISFNYSPFNSLGKDRIAGAVGATSLFPGNHILIIDIGTAITIDFIDKDGVFRGGVISPGPETRFKSLHHFTGKLPMVEPSSNTKIAGNNTTASIQYGVQNGILFEINEYILRYSEKYDELKVIVTGGYSFLFDKKIKYPIFANPFLVPIGLNRILEFNYE